MRNNLIRKSEDLITPKSKIKAGFISLALEKNFIAEPYIAEAKTLKIIASKCKNPNELLNFPELRNSLLTASGFSDKALNHLEDEDKVLAIKELIRNFLEPAGSDFVNELVYRYLLIKGDALGGKARNLAGILGERKFISAFISLLNIYGIDFEWLNKENLRWFKYKNGENIVRKTKAIYWRNKFDRILLFNVNVPIVRKNVDIVLLEGTSEELFLKGKTKLSIHKDERKYLALGELKGGLDPAGADEHWKTANSALNRIRKSFASKNLSPETFFIGAAIENSMAKEIFLQLEQGILANAANLTNDEQLMEICEWLINL